MSALRSHHHLLRKFLSHRAQRHLLAGILHQHQRIYQPLHFRPVSPRLLHSTLCLVYASCYRHRRVGNILDWDLHC
ncbi:hypothetical protein L208DRAFT_735099 [Tricholoma matsutake]|nr:hypothetical protein L208DRAFT_735099 [Tricholoma matsutake 945]